MRTVNPLRVIIKGLSLAFMINYLFGFLNPAVGRISLYNFLIPGRERFPFEDTAYEDKGHTLMLYEDFDAMFASHIISKEQKLPGEYRVALIGDSSVWGYNHLITDTLSADLNALGVSCNGREIVVYDLAYVATYLPKDLLILDQTMKYKPDLIIWFVTMDSFTAGGRANVVQKLFPYSDQFLDLMNKYRFSIDTFDMKRQTFLNRTIWQQRSRLKKLTRLQLDGFLWAATNVDFYIRPLPRVTPDMASDSVHKTSDNFDLTLQDLRLEILGAGYEIASPVPVLTVNEPIYIRSGDPSDVRYNSYYPRHAYDQYRSYLSGWMTGNNHPYLDLWDFVAPDEFADTPLHYSAQSESKVAVRLIQAIEKFACP